MTCAILMGHLSGLPLSWPMKFDTLIHIATGSLGCRELATEVPDMALWAGLMRPGGLTGQLQLAVRQPP